MAEVAAEIYQTNDADEPREAMDLESQSNGAQKPEENIEEESMDASNPNSKRTREEESVALEGDCDVSKKPKAENPVEEKQLEELEENVEKGVHVNEGEEEEEEYEEEGDDGDEEEGKEGQGEEKESASINLGPKIFNSSTKMFDYFIKLLHYWPPNVNVNKYEYTVLLDLLKKGHMENDKNAEGVCAFQVRYHPKWKSRCFFVLKEDGSISDFSFRKCIDKILPLPHYMKAPANTGYQRGGRGRGRGGRGGRRGRGRRGGFRK